MSKLLTFLLFILFQINVKAQLPTCEYQPLKFVDVDFTWSHLQIDSSFIGYIDTVDELNIYLEDGTKHINRDAGSFLDIDTLYSISRIKLGVRDWGYHLEKININTGEMLWQASVNKQNSPYGHRIIKSKLNGNYLEIYGYRRLEGIGGHSGTYFHHTYNKHTGELLHENVAVENDPRAAHLKTDRSNHFMYFMDTSIQYFVKRVNFEQGYTIRKYEIDTFGYLTAPLDTVIWSEYNNKWNADTGFGAAFSKGFERDVDSNFLFLDQFIPEPILSDIDVEGKLKLLDQNFNIIRSKDLKEFPLQDWGSMDIIKVDSNEILIGGCQNRDVNIQCDHFVYRLDKDWNLIDFIDARIGRWLNKDVDIYMNTDTLMMIDPTFILGGNTPVDFFKSRNGKLELVNTFIIEETDWVGFNNKSFILDNGDLLMRFVHSCYFENNVKGSWFAEWYRIPAHYFYFSDPVNNTEIPFNNEVNLYPNPVQDILHLDTEGELDGHIIIYAINGSKVLTQAISSSPSNQIDVSSLMPGLYTLSVINKHGIRPYKFMKL